MTEAIHGLPSIELGHITYCGLEVLYVGEGGMLEKGQSYGVNTSYLFYDCVDCKDAYALTLLAELP